ncbi:MAG: hypothetical protein A3B31_03535 [Candidatus Komeilibacteria bacterium RIFCSPLOWO2_01_FULL_53_11]|uniref:CoA-binding domain-containing protein n=1 Tax=Candidatus Komeilibacteria bacterium RIFCSPLOWO2_01_FULL_53_11 TaxID=1798552 RepID=A0A1G2BSG5_9BACT|nr:MAG: hypothetical protein A3B31_03535 [Candidatus Komeilibacteria bacterium RIFCSPLOWO2_01_FULL_53_11]
MKIAVVGASNNIEKYGNRIVRHLLGDGHDVCPVNPHEDIILGQPVYKKISDVPGKIDIVDIVVPPDATLKILKELRSLHGVNVWIQPGAESDAVIAYLEKHSRDFGRIIYNQCIMTSLEREYPGQSS